MLNVDESPRIPSGKTYWCALLQAMQDIDEAGITGVLVKFLFFLRDKKILRSSVLRAIAKCAAGGEEWEAWKLLHLFMEHIGMKEDKMGELQQIRSLPPPPPEAPPQKTGIATYGYVEWVDGPES